MARVADVARSALRPLLRELADESAHRVSAMGPGGPDLDKRLSVPRVRSGRRLSGVALPRRALAGLLQPDGPVAAVLQAYEARPQQEEMLDAVARALWTEEHLMAEAGTGVGKSLAYLLPAALYAVQRNVRVVVSTNTLNLQEQLIHKDLPTVQRVLEQAGLLGEGALAYTALKGRANYLCLQRWARLRSSDSLSGDEANLLGKLLLWLQETETGDRAELNLVRQESGVWDRLSAQGSRQCPILRGACFLRAARERAEGAHVVVVNHALLLTDLQLGGGLIPSYDHLIVDEAHHLEEEATRQFGFVISYQGLRETLDALVGPRGAATEAIDAYRTSHAAATSPGHGEGRPGADRGRGRRPASRRRALRRPVPLPARSRGAPRRRYAPAPDDRRHPRSAGLAGPGGPRRERGQHPGRGRPARRPPLSLHRRPEGGRAAQLRRAARRPPVQVRSPWRSSRSG